jgi:IS1 family transposase
MNILSREKQIEVIAALCEGVGIRTASRLTGVNRGTVGSLALRVGLGCMELHDRLMVGIRTERLELDEAWSFVGKKQKNVLRNEIHVKGDQYVFIGMAGTQKAIISWGVGKRNTESTMDFLHDLRSRVIGQPEISTDGFHPYRVAIRDAFGDSASHGVIVKTYSVTHLVKEAQGRYSPAAVVAVSKEVVTGDPDQYISTSYVERQNLSLRMGQRRFIPQASLRRLFTQTTICLANITTCRRHRPSRGCACAWCGSLLFPPLRRRLLGDLLTPLSGHSSGARLPALSAK